jgi:hypothetical protein
MRGLGLVVMAAAAALAPGTAAAPFSDPQGRFTINVPEGWRASAEAGRGPMVVLTKNDELGGGRAISLSVWRAELSLEREFVDSGFLEGITGQTERTVAGAPCIYAKQVTPGMPMPNDPNKRGEGFVMDRLLCSIAVKRDGDTSVLRVSLQSMGGASRYAEQHATFEAVARSLAWGAGVSAGTQ